MWPPKRILLAGIELEGGWENQPPFYMHGDGSVRVVAPFVGEISSDPMTPVELIEWMKTPGLYPDIGDATCGLHCHISLKSHCDYVRLTKTDFYDAFIKEMNRWGTEKKIRSTSEFWRRLRGENSFCRPQFIPEDQLIDGAERYTQLNYSFLEHGTLECRMLPLFRRKDIARDAIQNYLTFVDDFLLAARQKKLLAIRETFTFEEAA